MPSFPHGLRASSGVTRGIALFFGGFTLLNLVGELRVQGFDLNHWWIDLRPLPGDLARLLLAVLAGLFVAFGLWPQARPWRRGLTVALGAAAVWVAAGNAVNFFRLCGRGVIRTSLPLPLSLVVALALAAVVLAAARPAARTGARPWSVALTVLACLVLFPLAQVFCLGKTDYRRSADAIVVFGARVYADGRPSDALADRVRTACALYREGLAPCLMVSGGPGDGAIHEADAMARLAEDLGVPATAIVRDRAGTSTEATVANTAAIFDRQGGGGQRILAVSHFYHLPRIRLAYLRAGREVVTVPAVESYTLTKLPWFVAREVPALWVYYLRPLGGR